MIDRIAFEFIWRAQITIHRLRMVKFILSPMMAIYHSLEWIRKHANTQHVQSMNPPDKPTHTHWMWQRNSQRWVKFRISRIDAHRIFFAELLFFIIIIDLHTNHFVPSSPDAMCIFSISICFSPKRKKKKSKIKTWILFIRSEHIRSNGCCVIQTNQNQAPKCVVSPPEWNWCDNFANYIFLHVS